MWYMKILRVQWYVKFVCTWNCISKVEIEKIQIFVSRIPPLSAYAKINDHAKTDFPQPDKSSFNVGFMFKNPSTCVGHLIGIVVFKLPINNRFENLMTCLMSVIFITWLLSVYIFLHLIIDFWLIFMKNWIYDVDINNNICSSKMKSKNIISHIRRRSQKVHMKYNDRICFVKSENCW